MEEKKIKRKKYNLYFDEKVWKDYQKVIKPTGQSVSRVLETIMRLTTSPESEKVYNIFDDMFEAVKKHEGKK